VFGKLSSVSVLLRLNSFRTGDIGDDVDVFFGIGDGDSECLIHLFIGSREGVEFWTELRKALGGCVSLLMAQGVSSMPTEKYALWVPKNLCRVG
jgi:hypothetical protein